MVCWQPPYGCVSADTGVAQTQPRSIYDSDSFASRAYPGACPNAWPLGRVRGRGKRLGTLTRHIQGGWRAIVTQGARIARRSGRLRLDSPHRIITQWTAGHQHGSSKSRSAAPPLTWLWQSSPQLSFGRLRRIGSRTSAAVPPKDGSSRSKSHRRSLGMHAEIYGRSSRPTTIRLKHSGMASKVPSRSRADCRPNGQGKPMQGRAKQRLRLAGWRDVQHPSAKGTIPAGQGRLRPTSV
jgi:hypothetical protein